MFLILMTMELNSATIANQTSHSQFVVSIIRILCFNVIKEVVGLSEPWKNKPYLTQMSPIWRHKSRRFREIDMLYDFESMNIMIANSEETSMERELQNVYYGPIDAGRDQSFDDRERQFVASQQF